MKKSNNKGFSLVELIVVVAIMAVLVGVLAPAYLKYVEKSRLQKDISAVSEVVTAIEVAAANEEVYEDFGDDAVTVAIKTGVPTVTTHADLLAELTATVGEVELSSKALKDVGVELTVSVDDAGVVTITHTPVEVDDKDVLADVCPATGEEEETPTPPAAG